MRDAGQVQEVHWQTYPPLRISLNWALARRPRAKVMPRRRHPLVEAASLHPLDGKLRYAGRQQRIHSSNLMHHRQILDEEAH